MNEFIKELTAECINETAQAFQELIEKLEHIAIKHRADPNALIQATLITGFSALVDTNNHPQPEQAQIKEKIENE